MCVWGRGGGDALTSNGRFNQEELYVRCIGRYKYTMERLYCLRVSEILMLWAPIFMLCGPIVMLCGPVVM